MVIVEESQRLAIRDALFLSLPAQDIVAKVWIVRLFWCDLA
jgi:hypothetical protein